MNHTTIIMFLQLVFYASVFILCISAEYHVTFKFEEEQPAPAFVGIVSREAKLYENFTTEEFESLTYAAFQKDDSQKFTIDRTTSRIMAIEKLDREAICGNQLECHLKMDIGVYLTVNKVTDLKKILRVLIILEDINDNRPIFPENDVNLTVAESVSDTQEILVEGATDLDAGIYGVQSYELIPSNGMFGLNVMKNDDGSIDLGLIIKHELDRETKSMFEIKIVAKDGGSPPKNGTVRIQVHVSDINDNKPQFISKRFEKTVLESTPLNIPILQVVASDIDAGVNSQLTYSFTSQTPKLIRQFIDINPSNGEIFAIKPFDYESEQEFLFYVQVNDNGTPQKSDQAEVRIFIQDVNDNAPTVNINLPPSGTVLSEDTEIGAFIAHVSVSDEDQGPNGVIDCEIPDNHFSLVRFSSTSFIYKILLQRKLDFENTSTHLVNVTCHDQGVPPKHGSSTFDLTVTDENDNPPMFTHQDYIVSFTENNNVGDEVFKIVAKDKDSGLNGKVSYEKLDDNDMLFTLDSSSGIIRANKIFDRETLPIARFKVRAKDFGTPTLSSTVNVSVVIGDENDNAPSFSKPHFSFSVKENMPPGTVVDILNVTDADSESNSKLRFMFSGNIRMEDFFTVEDGTGIIRTSRVLNREKESKFDLSIKVIDEGNPEYKDSTEVTIYVKDENDNNPIINYPNSSNNTVYIAYTKPAGTVAAVIQAYDLDIEKNGELTYSIQKGNDGDVFFLNPRSGELVISRTLSLEDSKSYELMIAVRDNGNDPKTTYSKLHLVVTIGNGSLITYQNPQGSVAPEEKDNTTIVLTIVIVTIVLAVAVVVVILIVCRLDRRKKKRNNAKETCVRYDSPASESTYSTSEGQDYDSEKQLKPERVYTLRENSVSSDGSTQSLPFPSIEQSLLKPSSRSGSTQSLKNKPINMSPEPIDDPYRHTNNIHMWLQDQTLTKIPEDSTSQLSGGTEVSERDSGRGTSEEDSKIYHSDPDDMKPFSSPYNTGSKRVRFTDNNKNQPRIPLTYISGGQSPNNNPRDVVSRNIANSFKNSKNYKGYNSQGYVDPPPPPQVRGKHGYPPNYSDIYNNSISESVNEEDCSTTTSGSYTIANAYELCNDIDTLFFKDNGTTVV